MHVDRKRKIVLLRSVLLLVTALFILSVVLSPVISTLLFLSGAGLICLFALASRRTESIRIETSNVRRVPPGRSPPFFS